MLRATSGFGRINLKKGLDLPGLGAASVLLFGCSVWIRACGHMQAIEQAVLEGRCDVHCADPYLIWSQSFAEHAHP
jgi:hypothetical protein